MKKRNLNWLLALLAALALVFAGACSDGSDDGSGTEQGSGDDQTESGGSNTPGTGGSGDDQTESGGSNTPGTGGSGDDQTESGGSDSLVDKIEGTEWTFNAGATEPGTGADGDYLGEVTLTFGESGTVTGTASWWNRSSASNTAHAGTFSGSYVADNDNGVTAISVTLGSTTFTLTLAEGSSTTDEDGNVTITLSTSSVLTVGTLESASYTVSCGASTGCDDTSGCGTTPEDVNIFDDSGVSDAIESDDTFACTNAGSGDDQTG